MQTSQFRRGQTSRVKRFAGQICSSAFAAGLITLSSGTSIQAEEHAVVDQSLTTIEVPVPAQLDLASSQYQSELREMRAKAEANIAEMLVRIEALKDREQKARHALQVKDQETQSLENELTVLKQNLSVELQLRSLETEKLKAALENLRESQTALSKAIDEKNALVDETALVKHELVKVRSEIRQTAAEVEKFNLVQDQQFAPLQADFASAQSDSEKQIAALRMQIQTGQNKLVVANQKLADAKENLATRLKELAGLKADLSTRVELTKQQRDTISSLRGSLQKLEQESSALRTDLNASRDENRRLKEQLRLAKVKIGNLETEGRRLAALAVKLEQQVAAFETQRLADQKRREALTPVAVLRADFIFSSGSARLSSRGRKAVRALAKKLEKQVAALPENEQWMLVIEGHADKTPLRRSRYKTNVKLSMDRAVSVMKELGRRSRIDVQSMQALAMGSMYPVRLGDTREDLAANRRVVVRLVRHHPDYLPMPLKTSKNDG